MGTFQLQFRALILSTVLTNSSVFIGVIHGAAHRLKMIIEPRGAQIRVPFSVAPYLQILDPADNVVETGPDSELVIVAFVRYIVYLHAHFSVATCVFVLHEAAAASQCTCLRTSRKVLTYISRTLALQISCPLSLRYRRFRQTRLARRLIVAQSRCQMLWLTVKALTSCFGDGFFV